MSKQTINIGASPNDGTGTPLRTSFDYTNQNFTELYTALGGGVGLPGATTQVIFNDGGTNLAGDAGLVYNKTTDTLTAGNATITGALGVSGAANFNGGALAAYLNGSLMFGSGGNVVNFFAQSSGFAFKDNTGANNLLTISGAGVFGFGDGAGGTRMTLNSTGLGIGVSPSFKLDVQGSGIRLNSGSATGFAILRLGGTASDSFFGFAGNANDIVTGSSAGDTVIGSNKAGANLRFISGNGVLNATLDASGYLLLGTTDTTFTSGAGYKFGPGATPSNGQVGASSSNGDLTLRVYSTGAAAYRFYVGYGGTVFATSATISAISDSRFKENVQDIDVGLSAILALKPRKFDWKSGKGKDIKGDRGFIAQEFETVFPNLIDEWADPAPEGEAPYKSVRADLIPVLVKAIQELTARVQTLEAK